MAEPLYKWTEADGSITFSPNKPPAGVDYQVVETSSGITSVNPEPTSEPDLAASISAASTNDNASTRSPAITSIASLNLEDAAVEPDSVSWSSDIQKPAKPALPEQTLLATSMSNSTPGRCEDLQKRVVSLERRLKANLSPEDMDNTVVHMSRYQRSYDKFCVQ